MRPFIKDKSGHVRFKANAIVRWMTTAAADKRPCDLNAAHIACADAPAEDWEEFYQLIGYSLAGYHEIDVVSDEAARAATAEARKQFPECGGCRDVGCSIHTQGLQG